MFQLKMLLRFFPDSDVIVITGSTLINNTLDNILNIIPTNKQVIVVGPSASLIPDVFISTWN